VRRWDGWSAKKVRIPHTRFSHARRASH